MGDIENCPDRFIIFKFPFGGLGGVKQVLDRVRLNRYNDMVKQLCSNVNGSSVVMLNAAVPMKIRKKKGMLPELPVLEEFREIVKLSA
jgi:hypothetical protein